MKNKITKHLFDLFMKNAYLDSFISVRGQVFASVLVTSKNMEEVAIDLDISFNSQVTRSYELHVIVDILVFPSFQKWSFSDT